MKLKSILYKKEQDELVDKIINILELDNENSIILYNLDNDKTKQDKILELIESKFNTFQDFKIEFNKDIKLDADPSYITLT